MQEPLPQNCIFAGANIHSLIRLSRGSLQASKPGTAVTGSSRSGEGTRFWVLARLFATPNNEDEVGLQELMRSNLLSESRVGLVASRLNTTTP